LSQQIKGDAYIEKTGGASMAAPLANDLGHVARKLCVLDFRQVCPCQICS